MSVANALMVVTHRSDQRSAGGRSGHGAQGVHAHAISRDDLHCAWHWICTRTRTCKCEHFVAIA